MAAAKGRGGVQDLRRWSANARLQTRDEPLPTGLDTDSKRMQNDSWSVIRRGCLTCHGGLKAQGDAGKFAVLFSFKPRLRHRYPDGRTELHLADHESHTVLPGIRLTTSRRPRRAPQLNKARRTQGNIHHAPSIT